MMRGVEDGESVLLLLLLLVTVAEARDAVEAGGLPAAIDQADCAPAPLEEE